MQNWARYKNNPAFVMFFRVIRVKWDIFMMFSIESQI